MGKDILKLVRVKSTSTNRGTVIVFNDSHIPELHANLYIWPQICNFLSNGGRRAFYCRRHAVVRWPPTHHLAAVAERLLLVVPAAGRKSQPAAVVVWPPTQLAAVLGHANLYIWPQICSFLLNGGRRAFYRHHLSPTANRHMHVARFKGKHTQHPTVRDTFVFANFYTPPPPRSLCKYV